MISSIGRAFRLHRKGWEFESLITQINSNLTKRPHSWAFFIWLNIWKNTQSEELRRKSVA